MVGLRERERRRKKDDRYFSSVLFIYGKLGESLPFLEVLFVVVL